MHHAEKWRSVLTAVPSAQADTSAAAREQAATADARISDLSSRLESCESDLRQRTAELAEAHAAGDAASARAAALDSQCAAQLIALDEARDDAATAAMRATAAAASAELRHKETTVLLDEALAEGARLRAGEWYAWSDSRGLRGKSPLDCPPPPLSLSLYAQMLRRPGGV